MKREDCDLLQTKFKALFGKVSRSEVYQKPELIDKANEILLGLAKFGRRGKKRNENLEFEPLAYQRRHPALDFEFIGKE